MKKLFLVPFALLVALMGCGLPAVAEEIYDSSADTSILVEAEPEQQPTEEQPEPEPIPEPEEETKPEPDKQPEPEQEPEPLPEILDWTVLAKQLESIHQDLTGVQVLSEDVESEQEWRELMLDYVGQIAEMMYLNSVENSDSADVPDFGLEPTVIIDNHIVIINQPHDVVVQKVGDPVIFSVSASGSNLKYQWQYFRASDKSPTFKDAIWTGADTNVMFRDALATQADLYMLCKITDDDGCIAYSNPVRYYFGDPVDSEPDFESVLTELQVALAVLSAQLGLIAGFICAKGWLSFLN